MSGRRLLLALGALVLAACPHDRAPVTLYDDAGCVAQCGKCPPLAACVAAPYEPACLQSCSVTADCVPGHRCAVFTAAQDDGVCVSADSLTWCRQPACDIHAQCRDAQTLLRPLPFLDKACGWEIVRCDSGCDSTTAQCK